jgi:hypothetical protein
MAILVTDCPRCRAVKMTFDVGNLIRTHVKYDWQQWFEAFCVCRHCRRPTIFVLAQTELRFRDAIQGGEGLLRMDHAINQYVRIETYISLKDEAGVPPPEHLPAEIEAVFKEGATCLAVSCNNAAGTMFRLCLDLATNSMLPEGEAQGLNATVRRNLGLRLPWLFDNKLLPEGLRDLSKCVKDDGNDGAHAGTLTKDDAQDLLDFTAALLERLYTEPKRLELAAVRRDERRRK